MIRREHGHQPETGPDGERLAEAVSLREMLKRLEKIVKDPEVYRGGVACLRTMVNVGISTADLMPGGVGEIGSWTADAGKILAARFNIPMLDTSPDVPKWLALSSELTELVTGGTMPSHLVETALQLRADWPLIKRALTKMLEIGRDRQEKMQAPKVQEALKTFSE